MQMKFTYMGYIQTSYHLRALKMCLNAVGFFFPGVSVTLHFNGLGSHEYNLHTYLTKFNSNVM